MRFHGALVNVCSRGDGVLCALDLTIVMLLPSNRHSLFKIKRSKVRDWFGCLHSRACERLSASLFLEVRNFIRSVICRPQIAYLD